MKKIILFFIASLGLSSAKGELKIKIYDTLGREVLGSSKSLTKLGLFSDRFNIDNLEAGKYLLEITLNDEKIQKSFIKI